MTKEIQLIKAGYKYVTTVPQAKLRAYLVINQNKNFVTLKTVNGTAIYTK